MSAALEIAAYVSGNGDRRSTLRAPRHAPTLAGESASHNGCAPGFKAEHMKIALLSELHLSVQAMLPPAIDADVLVLAGDLHRPAAAIEWARQYDMPTLFVAGNHEFYGGDLVGTVRALRQHAKGSSVHMLEHDAGHRDGVRFLGCTLWA